MLRQDRVQTLRQTHRVMTTIVPLVAAALTVTGAVINSMESRSEKDAQQAEQGDGDQTGTTGLATSTTGAGREEPLTVRMYLFTLISKVMLVVLGIALVLALMALALRVGATGVAIELTVLILLALYLTEKVARRQARQQRRARRA